MPVRRPFDYWRPFRDQWPVSDAYLSIGASMMDEDDEMPRPGTTLEQDLELERALLDLQREVESTTLEVAGRAKNPTP